MTQRIGNGVFYEIPDNAINLPEFVTILEKIYQNCLCYAVTPDDLETEEFGIPEFQLNEGTND